MRRGVVALHADRGVEVQMKIRPGEVRRIGGDGLLQLRLDRGPAMRRATPAAINGVLSEQASEGVKVPPVQGGAILREQLLDVLPGFEPLHPQRVGTRCGGLCGAGQEYHRHADDQNGYDD